MFCDKFKSNFLWVMTCHTVECWHSGLSRITIERILGRNGELKLVDMPESTMSSTVSNLCQRQSSSCFAHLLLVKAAFLAIGNEMLYKRSRHGKSQLRCNSHISNVQNVVRDDDDDDDDDDNDYDDDDVIVMILSCLLIYQFYWFIFVSVILQTLICPC